MKDALSNVYIVYKVILYLWSFKTYEVMVLERFYQVRLDFWASIGGNIAFYPAEDLYTSRKCPKIMLIHLP